VRVLQVYNQQRSERGGEERVVLDTVTLLKQGGVDVELYMVTSRGLEERFTSKIKAAGSGIYSFVSYRGVRDAVERFHPDIVHVHNVYPLLSPSVFVACMDVGVPAVFSAHNQVLTCPTWHHLYKGSVCERCLGGKEYWCIRQNCRDNLLESSAYALRSAVARKRDLFRKNVTLFIAMSHFMEERLAKYGVPPDRIAFVPNMVNIPKPPMGPSRSDYVGFAGRLSPEKGIGLLLEAARNLPMVPFRIAGDGPLYSTLKSSAPTNVTFEGLLFNDELSDFYRGARMVVIPSVSYETAPLVALEALAHRVPLVCSRIGALPEVAVDGITGRLFDAGDSAQMTGVIEELWSDPVATARMGHEGWRLVQSKHTQEEAFARLVDAYGRAATLQSSAI